MNFKRGRPKQQRRGCLFCKYYKGNGTAKMTAHQTRQEKVARVSDHEVVSDLLQFEAMLSESRAEEQYEDMIFLSGDVE